MLGGVDFILIVFPVFILQFQSENRPFLFIMSNYRKYLENIGKSLPYL